MKPKLSALLLASVMLISILTIQGTADQYRKASLKSGGVAHKNAFVPDPEFDRYFNPPAPNAKRVPVADQSNDEKNKAGVPLATNGRAYYRTFYQTQPASKPGDFNTQGKLGSQWPKTLYNSKIGQGRELSRIFKP